MQESERLGIDFWLHLRMNDWHHWGAIEEDPDRPGLPANLNLYSSPFYEEHPEYLIGTDGVAGYQGDSPPGAMPYLQDFAHEEVRDSRIEVMVEACERYDVAGFHYTRLGQATGSTSTTSATHSGWSSVTSATR